LAPRALVLHPTLQGTAVHSVGLRSPLCGVLALLAPKRCATPVECAT